MKLSFNLDFEGKEIKELAEAIVTAGRISNKSSIKRAKIESKLSETKRQLSTKTEALIKTESRLNASETENRRLRNEIEALKSVDKIK